MITFILSHTACHIETDAGKLVVYVQVGDMVFFLVFFFFFVCLSNNTKLLIMS